MSGRLESDYEMWRGRSDLVLQSKKLDCLIDTGERNDASVTLCTTTRMDAQCKWIERVQSEGGELR